MELTKEHLSYYLPYDLEVEIKLESSRVRGTMVALGKSLNNEDRVYCDSTEISYVRDSSKLENIKPILRPMDDLIKPCKLDGYDEPVVPIVEIGDFMYRWADWYNQGLHEFEKDSENEYSIRHMGYPMYLFDLKQLSFKQMQFLAKHHFNFLVLPEELYVRKEDRE